MTEMQYRLLKCCDYLDLWIFCKNEVALGNNTQKIHSVIKHCNELLEKYSDNWNYFKSIKKFTENYVG